MTSRCFKTAGFVGSSFSGVHSLGAAVKIEAEQRVSISHRAQLKSCSNSSAGAPHVLPQDRSRPLQPIGSAKQIFQGLIAFQQSGDACDHRALCLSRPDII